MRLALFPLLPLAACVAAPPPPAPVRLPAPVPVAAAPPPVTPPVPADWRDRPAAPGGWRYAADAEGTGARAVFAAAGVTLSCGADGRVRLTVAGRPAGPLTVRASTAARTLMLGADGAAVLDARDPLLDAIAFSRGRFALEQPGFAPLSLPAQAELGRVTEDCRG